MKIEKAVSCFLEGFSCAQAILAAYGPEFGLDEKTSFKIATPFGGGMGGRGELCGAVTGALMVIGLKHGIVSPGDRQGKDLAYALVKEFIRQFSSRHESIICRDLLGFDISTPEGMRWVKEQNLSKTVCPKYMQAAVEILETIL